MPQLRSDTDTKITVEQKTVYKRIYCVVRVPHGKKEKATLLPYDAH